MASILDISLLSGFRSIFIILFIFTATYGILMFKKPFGDVKGVNALLSFLIAMMFIFVPDAIDVIEASIPWYVIMMIGIFMVMLITRGLDIPIGDQILKTLGTYVLIIAVFILLINVSLKFGQNAGPFLGNNTNPDQVVAGGEGDVAGGSFAGNFAATIFHPKVLGMFVVLLCCVFAIIFIGYMPM